MLTLTRSAKLFFGAFVFSSIFFNLIIHHPPAFLDDDAFFYAQIAYNFGELHQSTFDGITITNGYHVLWQLFLGFISILTGIFTHNKIIHLFLFILADIFIAFLLADAFFRKFYEKIICFLIFIINTLLMETLPLTIFLLIIIEKLIHGENLRPSRKNVLYFLSIILVPLTRIDSSIILLIMFSYLALKKRFGEYLFSCSFLAIGVSLHFFFLKYCFGDFFTVSSVVKFQSTSFSIIDALTSNLSLFNPLLIEGIVFRNYLMVSLSIAAIILLATHKESLTNQKLFFALSGVCVYFFMHFLFERARPWYFFPGHIVLFYIVLNADITQSTRASRFKSMAVGFFLFYISSLFLLKTVYLTFKHSDSQNSKYEFIVKIKEYTPSDALIYMIDACGYAAYFSDRRIINGDGLVNNYEYAKKLINNDLSEYLDAMKICFLIENRCNENGYIIMYDNKTNNSFPVYAPLHADKYILDFKGLKIRRDEVTEIVKSKNYGKDVWASYKLYRLNRSYCDLPASS